ncbi:MULTISPECIES: DUF5107 domain-containing protein [Clostridia]|uniref:DUF5107 domain-containing protein n=1 Tax=Clostridia TaxID=186801 RepID=UPI000E52AEB5|nr:MULTISPECIES: DUF5107 domain-containing protein [Clostridia]RHV71712.1 DUF5107 domain-containing protein [Roseburia sp. OM02-15]
METAKYAKIWEEDVVIPTYEIGAPDKNPMFLEKRVYQGSSGKVYPYPTTEKISHEKKDKIWHAVYLENEYLKVMILPELGGRIQRAYDKTNDYDFVYYNHVIKPALVGLAGPWISGGIEFNWPQHHRPTTYMPVDHLAETHEDGSVTLLVGDVDQMYGTKVMTSFTLYPGKAYIEIRGQLYNRTPLPQTFLWWANPAVSVNEYTQSIFPPDVHTVYDHGKRAVSRFPIAKGEYYKHDYSEGVDISRYKNIPVPTSYMAETSKYDFVGGYDYKKEAGLLHVADHHFSPGKKQWTWGCGEFGKAWDRNLTDEDGPYIELMTGVYTENQPDFSWLKPFEEKVFTQYFMPYKKVGGVKNASIYAALNLELTSQGAKIVVYATEEYADAEIVLEQNGTEVFRGQTKLSPVETYEEIIPVSAKKVQELKVSVYGHGRLLVAYEPEEETIPKLGEPAEAAKKPEEILTNEELLLTAQHIEQHRHATWRPDPYYLEGLKRDPGDIRINQAYGMLLMRRGQFAEAEKHFRAAIKRLTWRSPNPYDSEPYYNLGLVLFYQGRKEEAYDAFYKAAWTNAQQEMSYYYLACIACGDDEYEHALELVELSLVKNSHNVKARGLKAVLLRKLNRVEAAEKWRAENLELDAFDYVTLFENVLAEKDADEFQERSRGFYETYLQTARDYAEYGCLEEAICILKCCAVQQPMIYYYQAYYQQNLGAFVKENMTINRENDGVAMELCQKANAENSKDIINTLYERAEQCAPDYCFPNKLEDIAVLEQAIVANPKGAKAYYYLGNLYYDKLQYDRAITLWEQSIMLDASYPTVHRNLAIAYYNKRQNAEAARKELEQAFALDETDSRVFLELDQLYKKLGVPFEERLKQYEAREALIRERDDAMLEWVTLYNLNGEPQKAYDLIMSHSFRPWEGAEGRISGQYKIALTALAREAMQQNDYERAEQLLNQALQYPENLGEGRLEGTKDNDIYYELGVVQEHLNRQDEAQKYFELAQIGDNEPAGAMYYYDQPADMILYQALASKKLNQMKQYHTCLNKLQDYGERHLYDQVEDDFFAVSLPDFLIFEDDLTVKNKAHCYYLIGLSNLGAGAYEAAKEDFDRCIALDYNHQKSRWYRGMCKEINEKDS